MPISRKLAVIAVFGWWLRAAPLLRAGGPLAYPIDYDEGVYFSTAALFVRGELPYRDVLYAHPPGFAILLAPMAALPDLSDTFAAARIVATFFGVANIVLVGLLGRRLRGNAAGLTAAALYATFPEVVAVERGPFLEPLLNLLVLAAALAWSSRKRDLATIAGVALAAACAVKTWGAFSVAAILASATRADRQRLARFAIAFALTAAVLVLPLAALAPQPFLDDVLRFQLARPPDGVGRADRLRFLFDPAATIGFLVAVKRRERFVPVLYGLMFATFVTTPAFYTQYLAHLAIPAVLLAGYAAAAVWDAISARLPIARPALVALALAALALPAQRAIEVGRQHTPYVHRFAAAVERLVPKDDCVYAFDPAWTLAADRLPPDRPTVVADPYGAMLWDAVRDGERYVDANQAFESPAAQRTIRRVLEQCDWLVLGGRGQAQLDAENDAYVEAHFVRRYPPDGVHGLDLWERRRGVGVEG